jgi:hypothetical protein
MTYTEYLLTRYVAVLRSVLARVLAATVLVSVAGCTGRSDAPADSATPFGTTADWSLENPAGQNSLAPNLYASANGEVIMSWLERYEETKTRLVYAIYDPSSGGGWSEPAEVDSGNDWFTNWADIPSVVALSDGRLAAHYLKKSGTGSYAYGIMTRVSTPDRVWHSPAITLHADRSETEHGFATLLPDDRGGFTAVWLDGRAFADQQERDATNEMSLRAVSVDAKGRPGKEIALDTRTCDCCPTSAVALGRGFATVYRDRSTTETRDIHIVEFDGTSASRPVAVADDGWTIDGCPVQGPVLRRTGDRLAVAWFTAPNEKPIVNVAFRGDGESRFGSPIRVDAGNPIGRVDLAAIGDGRALVTWIEGAEDGGVLLARIVAEDGHALPAVQVTPISTQRRSGIPKLVLQDGFALFAWTDAATGRVTTARVPLRVFENHDLANNVRSTAVQ